LPQGGIKQLFSNNFPKNKMYGLISQTRRAVISIPVDIVKPKQRAHSPPQIDAGIAQKGYFLKETV